jgi:hypothetical protein
MDSRKAKEPQAAVGKMKVVLRVDNPLRNVKRKERLCDFAGACNASAVGALGFPWGNV